MYNILITGSKGFIGKNLIKKLKNNEEINILEFTRNDSIGDLINFLSKSDFIFHLAGEVRPDSNAEDFKNSNMILTHRLVKILEKLNKKIPILLVSSIHAKLLKDEYGKTKRESELLIEKYSIDNKANCVIYRLPHVFGEDCKPNYNSVISTWMFNSINNLEINVFDKNIKMNYVYVQDIVREFINKLDEQQNNLYVEPNQVYDTTLGEIVDYIKEFKQNIDNMKFNIKSNEFKNKLFNTYRNYYNKEMKGKL